MKISVNVPEIWVDAKQFFREEKSKADFEDLSAKWWLWFIPGLNAFALLQEVLALLVWIVALFRRNHLKRSIYDVENAASWFSQNSGIEAEKTDNLRIVRNEQGRYGLLSWKSWYFFHLVYKCKLKSIKRYDNVFVISMLKKGKLYYGMYNSEIKKEVLKIKFLEIRNIGDGIFYVSDNTNRQYKVNSFGERYLDDM